MAIYIGGTGGDNKLEDYEVGTWTPAYGWGNAVQSGFSFSSNYGFYTKIGHLVHIDWWTNFTASSSGTSTPQIQLPFTSYSGSGGYRGGVSWSWNNITFLSNFNHDRGMSGRTHINYNQSFMELGFGSRMDGDVWSSGAFNWDGVASSAGIQGSGTYYTHL